MFLTLVPIGLILALIVLTFYSSFKKERKRKNQLIWLFDLFRVTRQLIQYIPQHRGMANAYLKGDASFKPKMEEMQSTIDEDIRALLLVSQQPSSMASVNDIRAAEEKWATVKQHVFSLTPEKSFDEHTALISEVLNIIEDSSELTSLSSDNTVANNDDLLIIRAVIKDIPHLTETLGQARGLGTGIAAQAECSVANRIKLEFIHNKGKRLLENTIKLLIDLNHSQLESNRGSLQACWDKTQFFLGCMNDQLITASQIKVDPTEYYTTATGAIDNSFELLDQLLDTLEKIVLKK